ncbi:unnamed protein product [Acanthoscelides obtectus]|uniref:C2H2-type domain-containing protein n=1 Tax=Acanthoscelides obtectus TaxID=200917 RepID=A0A9P0PSE8_ACAOB|nr:unnamed protein product [Acanthoscelides obtectus]CAK1682242.1 hypothetical protein AOBTE_LOCUS33507 [Acanthoscelides obtectus]
MRVTALFVSEERGVAGRRKGRRRGQNKRGNRRYLYARTQDIYKKEPGILAKHVSNNVDWLEEPGLLHAHCYAQLTPVSEFALHHYLFLLFSEDHQSSLSRRPPCTRCPSFVSEGVRTRDITSRHPTRKRKLDTNEGKPIKSPPAGGKSTAGGPTATGTKLAGSSTISLIPGPSNTVTLQPANSAPYRCHICERPYETKSGLNKHLLTCGKRDRTKCQYCNAGFTTYTGVRLHEQKAHPEPENDNRRRELRRPDSEIYDILATIETQTHKGPFMAKMVAESGLTKDQIRHRRDKPIYKQYLDAATKKQLIPSPSVPCEPPTCLTSEKNDYQAATSTPPSARDDVKEGECSAAVASTLLPLSPDPTTNRRRIRQESMSPLSQPTVRRPRTEADNLTANSPAQVEQTQVVIEPALREYFASEREAALANGNGHLADLCQAGSSLAINDLASYLDNWILELFQKGGRKYNSNGYRGGQKPKNYGGTRPGRGPRVESYKKAQDLYLHNKTALVDKIISGIPLDSTEEVPPLKAVEELTVHLY